MGFSFSARLATVAACANSATANKEVKQADATVKKVAEGEPDMKDPKYANDYGRYLRDIAAWEARTATAEAIKKDADARAEQATLEKTKAAYD